MSKYNPVFIRIKVCMVQQVISVFIFWLIIFYLQYWDPPSVRRMMCYLSVSGQRITQVYYIKRLMITFM